MTKSNVKLKELADIDSYKMWYSPQVVESDHPTYLVVQLLYTDEWGDEPEFKYCMAIAAAGSAWPSEEKLNDFVGQFGITAKEFHDYPLEGQLEALVDSGLCAILWQKTGNNKEKLLREAREEINKIQCFFGFYMDKHQNQIGATGWDWIQGNCLGSLEHKEE